MTTKDLDEYILHYLKEDKTQTAIMLTGEWGSGKTYYIENSLVPYLKGKNSTAVVVSLYGIDDVSLISKSIFMELRFPTFGVQHSEKSATRNVIAKSVLKNIVGWAGINLELKETELNKLYESVNLKDKLLILEDVERSNISIIKLMGYINGLVERDGAKVLLVANENEILKKDDYQIKFGFTIRDKNVEENKDKINTSDEIKTYLRIKEKTISDTIKFNGVIDEAIQDIVKGFDNKRVNTIFEKKPMLYKEVADMVSNLCKNNLRTFIYALQKTTDIIDKIGTNEYEDDFFECLMFGIINFSASIKSDDFPRWEGDDYLSVKLGTIKSPLMRLAYDYIRWQTFEDDNVEKSYEALKEYRFFEKKAEYNDADIRVLANYYIDTEENVLAALRNIERKLKDPKVIGIYAYCKLAYYMIDVGSILYFDYKPSLKLMIKNAKGINKLSVDEELRFAHVYTFENEKNRKEYEKFIKKLSEAFSVENEQQDFTYEPAEIEILYNDIFKYKSKYVLGHRFISKYDITKMAKMLTQSTSKQIDFFRGILFEIYRNAQKGDFDEKDIEAFKELRIAVGEIYKDENHWDKIQLKQIEWLMKNLNDFIKSMS